MQYYVTSVYTIQTSVVAWGTLRVKNDEKFWKILEKNGVFNGSVKNWKKMSKKNNNW